MLGYNQLPVKKFYPTTNLQMGLKPHLKLSLLYK